MRPRTHNVLSYALALLVFAGVALGRGPELSANALLGLALWTAHFAKRTLESAFVHRYGKPRIGASDYLTEYAYYWGFAAWVAWSLTSLKHHAPALGVQLLGVAVFTLAEAGNARAHVLLRRLRSPGTAERRIPRGFLFEWVSCPHYACEILAWVGFNLATGTFAGVVFMLVGAGILAGWARTRHLAYKQEFSAANRAEVYPAKRRALLPGVF